MLIFQIQRKHAKFNETNIFKNAYIYFNMYKKLIFIQICFIKISKKFEKFF